MKRVLAALAGFVVAVMWGTIAMAHGGEEWIGSPHLDIESAEVRHMNELGLLIFDQVVAGEAGAVIPEPVGSLDGAAVIAYVFPLDLDPSAVGFEKGSGILALVVAVHPDFDDTPLWDENNDGDPGNDGGLYHAHWAVLEADERTPGGLAVKAFSNDEGLRVVPATHPGLDLHLDSPGFSVRIADDILRVLVPTDRVGETTEFHYDAVTAYLEVNASNNALPMLGVYVVYDVLSGDLSMPFTVTEE